MKNILLLLTFMISLPIVSQAQIKKKIGFIPYTNPENADKKYRELAYKNIYDAALRVFVNTQRFDVLDRGSFDIIKIEKEFQKGEDLANVTIVDQGRVKAAELLAVAKLSTFTITESDDGNGYSIFITAEFKQLDVESGQAMNAYQMRAEAKDFQANFFGGESKKRISTVEQAISMAVKKMEIDLEKWIKRQFPLILKVLSKENDNRAIIVEGGTDVGLNEKHKMKLIELTYIGDKKLMKSIGKINFSKDGVGEELTTFILSSKKAWASFLTYWKEDENKIFVTEDL